MRSENKSLFIPVISQSDADFATLLISRLKEQGYDPYLIPEDPERRDLTINIPSTIVTHHTHEPNEPLQYYLSKFDIKNAKNIVLTEMIYDGDYPLLHSKSSPSDSNTTKYINKLHRLLSYFDQRYSKNEGGIPIQYIGGDIIRLSLRIVSEFYGYDNVWIGFSPVRESHSLFDDEYVNWPSFNPEIDVTMTNSERKQAEKFIENYIGSKRRIKNLSEPDRSISHYLSEIPHKFKKLADAKDPRLVSDFISRKAEKKYRRERITRKCLSHRKSEKYIKNNKIVYFPHQFHVESRITVRGKQFYNFDWIMEYVSRSIPFNHSLVIKLHPERMTTIPPVVVDRLSDYITFVSPELNSHDIVRESSAVVTINNTVGFEALLHGKPVVCLGNAFYDGCEYTFDISNLEELDSVLHSAISSEGLTYDQRLEIAHRTLLGSYPGTWGVTASKNVRQLFKSIEAIITAED